MNEITLPPSPNWYLSNIFACSRRGTIAWGSRNYIVIAKQEKTNNILQYTLLKEFSKTKVCSLAFCPKITNPDDSDCPELLICGGDDDKVKIWNIDKLDVFTEFDFSDDKPVVAVDWSIVNDNFAYAINSDSCLMCCNIKYRTMKKISLGKLLPTCMACCPHDANVLAVGSKSGLVYIIQKGTILYKMRGHDREVVSLSWCPSQMNVLNGDNKKDTLLASGAKDRSVYIWRALKDGRYERVINLPYQPVNVPSQHKNKFPAETWTAVCWAEPKILLTSSTCGEVLSWDLSENKSKPTHQLFQSYHTSRGLFCIVNVPKNDAMINNWRADSETMIWTVAQDRWIVCYRKRNNEPATSTIIEYKIPTQGGYVYCMEACPIDTSRIAFGVGDMMLRSWNLSEPHTTSFDITMHWQKIKGKIRALSWMPNNESAIAFGTGEGRVGVLDTFGAKPMLFRQYHRNTVYKLEWAEVGSDYLLFSCAEGELVAYNKSIPQDQPRSIIKQGCTEFSWKSNLCLAVALENGSIMFYDQELKKRSTVIHVLRNIVNCLVWHPESTVTDKWISPFSNYLAVASDSNSIIIFDMSELIKELETMKDLSEEEKDEINNQNKQKDHKLYKIVTTLEGHSEKVVCLAWSSHVSGLLVSGSYDNVAQVWNVEKQELLATFMGHDGPVLSCMWSPLKPQLIITGSLDFTLRVWDYTSPKQSPVRSTDIKFVKKKNKQKSQKKTAKNITDNVETHNNLVNSNESQSTNPAAQPPEVIKSDQVKPLSKDIPKKKEKKYFIKYNSLLNNNTTILDLIKNDIRQEQSKIDYNNSDNVKISLFSEQTEFLKYLAVESLEHRARGNNNIATEMDIWSGNLQENLMTAVKEYRLNDFLVSLAPSLSMKLWREMCEAYAQQLILEGNVEKAVSYLLSIHKIYEAIETFINYNMYKEAYALAKCRLDADNPVLKNILESWAKWLSVNGQLEQAAYCYVQQGHFGKAAQTLARRKNVYCLEIGSELAFLSGNEEYGISLIVEAMTRSLINLEWQKARSLITPVRKVQYLNVHIDVHEAIVRPYRKQKTKFDAIRTWLKEEELGILQILREKYDVSYNKILENNAGTSTALKNEMDDTMMHLNISYQIAIAATYDARKIQLHHIAKILGDAFVYEKTLAKTVLKYETRLKAAGFFIYILTKLDTRKPVEQTSIYAKSDHPVSQSIRAYLCIGLLNLLLDGTEELSIEEETQLTQIILDLLDDAINETTLSYQKIISDFEKAEDIYKAFLHDMQDDITNNDDYKRIKENFDKLEFDKKEFTMERVCMPNPMDIFHTACLVADKLRDDVNHSRFLHHLNKLVKTEKIELSETEKSILQKLEDLSHKIDSENILETHNDKIKL